MKSTKQKIIDRGLKPRQIIFDVIDMLVDDRSKNFASGAKGNKIILWHVALSDLSSEQIRNGMIKISRSSNEFIPDAGTFHESCLPEKKGIPHFGGQNQEDVDLLPIHDSVLNNKNIKAILEKLKGGGQI